MTYGQVTQEERIVAPRAVAFSAQAVGEVVIGGHLGERIDACLEASVVGQDVDHIVEPFFSRQETRWWQSEFWGKWMLSAVKAYEYRPDETLMRKMSDSVERILESQSPDGYIGNYKESHRLQAWDVWGRKYTLLGLIYYYDLTGDRAALAGARRLADHTMGELGRGEGKTRIVLTGNYRGMASSSILEPIILLYERTGHGPYLDFAEYIVEDWETPQGPQLISKALAGIPVSERFTNFQRWWSWGNGQKAYEMISCYDGLLRLYQITGEASYLEAVRRVVDNIIEEEINLAGSGASKECWFRGADHQAYPAAHTMEVCVTVYWMKLCYELYRLTGDATLVDQIEKSAYNNLLGSLMPHGGRFAKYSALQGYRDPDGFQCNMHTNCCMANGPRGLTLLKDLALTRRGRGLAVNLYNAGVAEARSASGQPVKLTLETEYPKDGVILMTLGCEQAESFPLYLRDPSWSAGVVVEVNGTAVDVLGDSDSYLAVDRKWRSGDQIRVEFDMPLKINRLTDGHRDFMAFTRGPLLLAADSRHNELGVDFEIYKLEAGLAYNRHESPLDSAQLSLSVQLPYGSGENQRDLELNLCDFASAGNAWDASNRYRAWFPVVYDPSQP